NLLIANDNLIAECLSQEVFFVAPNSELNVARFTEMHVANTTVKARCLALEAELANLYSQITKLTGHVTHLQAQNDMFRAENNKIKQHYKELYDSIKITRAKHIEHVTKLTAENVNLKSSVSLLSLPVVTLSTLMNYWNTRLALVLKAFNNELNSLPTFLSLGRRVNSCPNASGSHLKSNVKPNRISPAKGVNKLPVEDQPRTNKSHLRTSNHLDSSSRLKRCSKPMTGDRSRLMNFVKKFIGIVRFRNDHFGAIMGYGDYVIGNSVISKVYYVKGLGHNLFFVEKFCDSDLEFAF
nr:integrase, catalytic region, zinc finger, CCHC-type, peptidase aspartic, catalytic [Tanacetum cinerariifolium]